MTDIKTQLFIARAIALHGNRYDYTFTVFNRMNDKIKTRCNLHSEELHIRAMGHLKGNGGCKSCKNENIRQARLMTREEFIRKAVSIHGNLYDYSKLEYTGVETLMTIICQKHGEFTQLGQNHIHNVHAAGCWKCGVDKRAITQSMTYEEFQLRAREKHGLKFLYEEAGDYKNVRSKVCIKCSEHGWFAQTAEVHLRGHGCPLCSNFVSAAETTWLNELKIPYNWRQWKIFANGKQYLTDACDIHNKIVYEFYGDFWHGNPNVFNAEDINPKNGIKYGTLYKNTIKREAELKELGFSLITIWEQNYHQRNSLQIQPP